MSAELCETSVKTKPEISSDLAARVREKLITARVALLMRKPFFGTLATRLTLVAADEWCPTAATDGRKFYFNHRFVDSLKGREVEFLFGHEVLHAVYDHMGRLDRRDPMIWNIAADYCVNFDLVKHGIGEKITTVPCLYDVKYDGWSAEEVYDDLTKNATKINFKIHIVVVHTDKNRQFIIARNLADIIADLFDSKAAQFQKRHQFFSFTCCDEYSTHVCPPFMFKIWTDKQSQNFYSKLFFDEEKLYAFQFCRVSRKRDHA